MSVKHSVRLGVLPWCAGLVVTASWLGLCGFAVPAGFAAEATADAEGFTALFDGKTLDGWEGSREWFRVEDGAVVGGSLEKKVPRNEFLTSKEEFADFELRLKFKLVGEGVNAGIQIRSRRIPNHHEMIGYQADLGQEYTGALYDESRRRTMLARPMPEALAKAFKPNEWNEYRIRCEGPRVQLWINDVATVDYT
ncbi:MAG TPA: DUF1080 domain-containing protein, partial [Pirellulales bacterium]